MKIPAICCSWFQLVLTLRQKYMTLSYSCGLWSMTSALFEHMWSGLMPVVYPPPISKINHTVTKASAHLKEVQIQLNCHLLPQNWILFIMISNPLPIRQFYKVRLLLIWAESYLVQQCREPCLPSLFVSKDRSTITLTFLLTQSVLLKNFSYIAVGEFIFFLLRPR